MPYDRTKPGQGKTAGRNQEKQPYRKTEQSDYKKFEFRKPSGATSVSSGCSARYVSHSE